MALLTLVTPPMRAARVGSTAMALPTVLAFDVPSVAPVKLIQELAVVELRRVDQERVIVRLSRSAVLSLKP